MACLCVFCVRKINVSVGQATCISITFSPAPSKQLALLSLHLSSPLSVTLEFAEGSAGIGDRGSGANRTMPPCEQLVDSNTSHNLSPEPLSLTFPVLSAPCPGHLSLFLSPRERDALVL